MSKKKRPNKPAAPARPVGPLPVLHGNAFVTMLDEGRQLCNEVIARREFDADVVEYLTQKDLLEEWAQFRSRKRGGDGPPTS